MKPEKNILDTIAAYLDGSLQGAERESFEARVNADQSLADQLQEQKLAYLLLRMDRRNTLSADLSSLLEGGKVTSITPKPVRKYRIPMSIAASVIILILFSFGLLRTNYSNSSLASSAFTPYTCSGALMGQAAPVAQEGYEAGIESYCSESYEEASRVLADIPTGDKDYTAAQFYLGNSYLSGKSYSQAAIVFENLLKNDPGKWEEQSKWYLGLAYLGDKEQEKAVGLFTELSSTSTDIYKEKSDEMLEKLETGWRKIPGVR